MARFFISLWEWITSPYWWVYSKIVRLFRGYTYSDLWNLDVTIAKFVIPRIKAYRKHMMGHPADVTEAEWDEILDKIVLAFELIANQWDGKDVPDPEKFGDYPNRENMFNSKLWRPSEPDEREIEWFIEHHRLDELRAQQIDEGMKLFAEYHGGLWI